MSQHYLSIFEAAEACQQRLQQSVNASDFPALANDDWARKRLADFRLWASGSGALAKQRTLDERLASQPQAKKVVINLICLLEVFLEQCQSTAQVREKDSPGLFQNAAGEDNAASPSIDELALAKLSKEIGGVEVMINQLVRISIAIHRSGARARLERADQTFKANRHCELRDHLSLLIYANTLTREEKEVGNNSLDVHSKSLTDIQLRLINANLRRRHRFLYAQRRLRKQEEGDPRRQEEQQQTQTQTVLANRASYEGSSPSSRVEERPGELSQSKMDHSAPLTETNSALTALDGPIEIPMGSQLSMMVPSSTSAKVVYPRALKIPGRELFTCPCCCQSLPIYISSGPKWRKHLSEDISPYTCVLLDCSRPQELYSSRKDWMDHMQKDHASSQYWLCLACPEPSKFNKEVEFVHHLEYKHSDTVSADQIPLFVSECSCTAPLEIPSCPLCPPSSSGVNTSEAGAVLEEIAKHVHSFSLNSLPWPIPGEEEKDYLGWEENDKLIYFDINSNQGSLDEIESLSSEEPEREFDVEGLLDTEFEEPVQDHQSAESMQDSAGQWDDVYATGIRRKDQPEPDEDDTLQRFIENYKLEERTRAEIQEEPLDQDKGPLDVEEELLDNREEPLDILASTSTVGMVIVVAVDFGMTFSSIAYAGTLNPSRHKIIQSWGAGVLQSARAPTVLRYDNDGTSGPFKWGFEVPEDGKKHEWFKLGINAELEASSELLRKYPSPTAFLVYGDECEKLITDYLTSLRKHADSYFKSHFGSTVSGTAPREYIITVPGIWSDKAHYRSRICAEKAGMGNRDNIQIISEPEAAGIYALDSMTNIGLTVDDTFVVCAAGGGTVELVSYTVKSLQPLPTVSEASPGSGGLCGSSFLNRIFAKYLDDRLKEYHEWNAEWQDWALQCFEKDIKRRFTDRNDENFSMPVLGLSDNSRYGIKNRRLEIPSKDLQEKVFEPVIMEIQKLVQNQISETTAKTVKVKAVLLAGGFGQNEYLLRRLQTAVGIDVPVRVVMNCNTAIVRGALIRGLAGKDPRFPDWRVDSRIARKHFGIACYVAFDPEKHDMYRKEGHPYGEYRIKVMRWFIEKGSSVKEGQERRFSLQRVSQRHPASIDLEIFVCEDPIAPVYQTMSVKSYAKLKADLSSIPEKSLNKVVGKDGEEFYKIDFDFEIALHSASLSFSLVYLGNKYKTVEVEFI